MSPSLVPPRRLGPPHFHCSLSKLNRPAFASRRPSPPPAPAPATPSAKEVLAAGVEQYDALYLAGGHGAMLDFAESDVKALVEAFWTSGRVVAAVCHGPAGLIRAVDAEGAPIVKGRRATGFTNSEEEGVGKNEAVPFMLETRLVELGALFEIRDDWQPHVVVDGQLITGQNPQSSFALAQAVAGALAPHAQVCEPQGDS